MTPSTPRPVAVGATALLALLTCGTSAAAQAELRPKPVAPQAEVKPTRPATRKDVGIKTPTLVQAGGRERMVLDLKGDGLGPAVDPSLAVDATSLRESGRELTHGDGRRVEGRILVTDGLRLAGPDGKTTVITDPWHFLGALDSNHDGRVDGSDAGWPHLAVHCDDNRDGRMGAGEFRSLDDSRVRSISLARGQARDDRQGNRLVPGTFTRTDGTTGNLASVSARP